MDGTFDTAPLFFVQIFTIHVFVGEKLIPLIYCLMARKSREAYKKLFRVLKDKAIENQVHLEPQFITIDFESGLIPAINSEFPSVEIHGCYFHFCQAIHRKIRHVGLALSYQENPQIRLTTRMLMALAFLPSNMIHLGFTEICNSTPENIRLEMEQVLNYMSVQWLPENTVRLWNVYGLDRRTNNDLEGWHLR